MILLIGGSNDGKRIDPDDVGHNQLIYMRSLPRDTYAGKYSWHIPFVSQEKYRLETITSGSEVVKVYVHESISPMEAFKCLIEKYPKNDKE